MPRPPLEYIDLPAGVRLSKTPDGRGNHRIRFTKADGTPGEARRASWREAEAFAWELVAVASRQAAGYPANGDQPIADLIEVYNDPSSHRPRLAPSTHRNRRIAFAKHVTPVIGHIPAAQWAPPHTEQVADRARETGLAETTVANLVRTLSALARFGRDYGWLTADQRPTDGIVSLRGGAPIAVHDLPSARDIADLAAGAYDVTGQAWRSTQIYTLAYTGMRAGEMLGLPVSALNVKPDEAWIRLDRQLMHAGTEAGPKFGPLKARAPGDFRNVPLPRHLVEDCGLADHAERRLAEAGPDAPLFPGPNGYEPYSTFKLGRFNAACHAAGWRKLHGARGFVWTPHTLRHYYATWALTPHPDGWGLSVAEVSRALGHSKVSTTYDLYVATLPGSGRRAWDRSEGVTW